MSAGETSTHIRNPQNPVVRYPPRPAGSPPPRPVAIGGNIQKR